MRKKGKQDESGNSFKRLSFDSLSHIHSFTYLTDQLSFSLTCKSYYNSMKERKIICEFSNVLTILSITKNQPSIIHHVNHVLQGGKMYLCELYPNFMFCRDNYKTKDYLYELGNMQKVKKFFLVNCHKKKLLEDYKKGAKMIKFNICQIETSGDSYYGEDVQNIKKVFPKISNDSKFSCEYDDTMFEDSGYMFNLIFLETVKKANAKFEYKCVEKKENLPDSYHVTGMYKFFMSDMYGFKV